MANTRTKPKGQNYPKTDMRYWRDRLVTRSNKDWQVQIGYAGRQERFPLKTANQEHAAIKARDIYLSLHHAGWDATIAKFKPWTTEAREETNGCTVGKFIESVRAVAPIKPTTFLTYERKFRFLVSQIKSVKGTRARHDHVNGSKQWRAKIESTELSDITPEEITKWRVRYITENSATPLKANSARQTAASIIRNAKALFNPKLLKHVSLALPDPLPFDGVELGKRPRTRYHSKVNAPLVAKLAHDELKPSNPELFKIFLLAFGAGLRRGEIDKLAWTQWDWTKGTIKIDTTEYGDTKTEGSKEEIDIGDDMLSYFKLEFANSKTAFVISSAVEVNQPKHWNHYRCDHHFKELIEWLRKKGVKVRNPIHTLRKEFGSLINQKFGIYAASAALRHSNITITREAYVDKKERIALDLGELMNAGGAK
jgi:integrase